MPRTIPPPLSVTLTVLRVARGWSQRDLADALAIDPSVLSGYEKGAYPNRRLSRRKLEEFAEAMGFGSQDIDLILLMLEALSFPETAPSPDDGPSGVERQLIKRTALRLGLDMARLVGPHLGDLAQARSQSKVRRRVSRLWRELESCTAAERRLLVEKALEFQSWGLCVRLCEESERAAAHEAGEAIELAELALRVAELAPGDDARRSRHLGYARGFLGNARRVGGDLHQAVAEFARAWTLWREGEAAGDVLPEWRLHDREASLRRALRQWSAALELLDRARTSAPPEAVGRILLNRAATFDQAGEIDEALVTLREAAPLIEAASDLRLRWALRFNSASALCHLERYEEAADLLPGVQEAADSLGNALDVIRALWLTGRIAAGQGRKQQARAAFEQVRTEFAERRIGYDAALVSLDLSILYLEDGRTAEVRTLATEMAWIFDAQGVHREALAALALFCRAAKADTLSVELVRQLVSYLERARHDKELRFEARAGVTESNP